MYILLIVERIMKESCQLPMWIVIIDDLGSSLVSWISCSSQHLAKDSGLDATIPQKSCSSLEVSQNDLSGSTYATFDIGICPSDSWHVLGIYLESESFLWAHQVKNRVTRVTVMFSSKVARVVPKTLQTGPWTTPFNLIFWVDLSLRCKHQATNRDPKSLEFS